MRIQDAVMTNRNARRGFTLIELLVAIAVLAILATVAVPSFQQIIENNRLATESNRLLSAMSFARSEAVRVGDDVSLTAPAGGFGDGWCVHLGASCTNATRLRRFDGGQVDYSAANNTLTFNARGEMTNAAFQVSIEPGGCDSGAVDKRRTINVSLSGRGSVQKGNCS
jgi:type IV fimbrial biogenesis protein FimT